jgi:hypothetical protein
VTTIKAGETQVLLTIKKHKIILLIDPGASIPAIPFSPGARSSKKITVRGLSGQPLECDFTQTVTCSWGDFHFYHSFLIVPETPTPLLGQDFNLNWGYSCFYPQESTFACPDRGTSRPHSVDGWTHHGTGMNRCLSPNLFQGPFLVSPSETISFKARS